MPIQGNGMHGRPGQNVPKPADAAPVAAPETKPADADPITAAVTQTLGRLDTGLGAVSTPDPAALADVVADPKLTPEQAKAVASQFTSPGDPEQPRGNNQVVKGNTEVVLDPDLPKGELERRLLELRDPPPVVVHVPSPPTPRMVANTEAEMAAGRARIEHFREIERQRPKPEHNPRDGTNVEVRRDGNYQHERGNNARTV